VEHVGVRQSVVGCVGVWQGMVGCVGVCKVWRGEVRCVSHSEAGLWVDCTSVGSLYSVVQAAAAYGGSVG
jgi:hypothetical protein